MDFSSYKTWEKLVCVILGICAVFYFLTPSCSSDSNSNSGNSVTGTYVEYISTDKSTTRTYVINSDGSATITFKTVGFKNQIETNTEYGYWNKGNGYIEVISDRHESYIDLNERMVYDGYKYYRSRQGGCKFTKTN